MRKFVTMIMASLMAVSLVACGGSGKEDGMKSPLKEVTSLEDLSEAGDFAIIKPTTVEVTDEVFQMIEGEPEIAEYMFKADGVPAFVRFAKADKEVDISGLHGEDGETLFQNSEAEEHYIENDDIKADRFFNLDGQYVVEVEDKGQWDWDKFEAFCKEFKSVQPKSWTSDVPYAELFEISGYYSDEKNEHMAAVNITGDHLTITTATIVEEGNLNWEVEAVKDGDKLVYEKESSKISVYDEESGEMTESDPQEAGAGYITIVNGDLDFSNVNTEGIKGLLLHPMK